MERQAKEVRKYEIDAEFSGDPEEVTERVYEVALTDSELHDLFYRYWITDQRREAAIRKFRMRIQALGHIDTGLDDDMDYDRIALDATRTGRYSEDSEARIHAGEYLTRRNEADLIRYAIQLFGFSEQYGQWLLDRGYGARSEDGSVTPHYDLLADDLK